MRRFCILFTVVLACLLGSCQLLNIGNVIGSDEDNHGPYMGADITEVTFQILGPNQVQISWVVDFGDETGFYADRHVDGGQWDFRVAQCSPNVSVLVDSSAVLGEIYTYRIYAVGNGFESVGTYEQFNFLLPAPNGLEYDFDISQPAQIRLYWDNHAAWADSIVISKREGENAWVHQYGTVPGNANEYMDLDLNIGVANTWGVTAYYQNHISTQTTLTLMPQNARFGKDSRL